MANKVNIKGQQAKKNTSSTAKTQKGSAESTKQPKVKGIGTFLFGCSICLMIIIGVVVFTDIKGYFNPDYTNDHTRRKWNSFYKFTKEQPVDVVLVGNSHLYTGLNPENLSNALGVSAFILASPGTTLTDTYYCLKEVIAVRKPKLAVVETFTIYDYKSHELKDGALSDQFKSFSARKNVPQKLSSTPVLFTSGNYLSAWSNTIRNHSFLFTDTAQINRNKILIKKPMPERPGLYLGRFIRFTSGLEAENLAKYDEPDFIGSDYSKKMPSAEAAKYIHKIINLCEENDVELVFLTLPMYHKHVHNYEPYKEKVLEIIGDKQVHWLDLQLPYDTIAFGPECFENTVADNQHMTLQGSLVAAYKLANYIQEKLPEALPDRSSTLAWKKLFYASGGYFESNSPEDDGVSKVLLKNTVTPSGIAIKEIDFVPQEGGAKRLLVKVEKPADATNDKSFEQQKLIVFVEASLNGQSLEIPIEVQTTLAYQPVNHVLYLSEPMTPQLDVLSVKNIVVGEN